MSDEQPSNRWKSILGGLVFLILAGTVVWLFRLSDRRGPVAVSQPATPLVSGDSVANEIASLETMRKAHSTHAPILLRLANLYEDRNNHAKALECYREGLALDTSASAWELRLDVAKELFALGKTDSARMELESTAKDHPDHPGVLYNLGAMAANGGDVAKAKGYWERLVQVAPQSSEGLMAKEGLGRLGN